MIRALVVDDSPTLRHLIRAVLESDPELIVVAEASNGEQALAALNRYRPDVITMDIHMPVMDGFEAIRRIMTTTPCPIVVLTSSNLAKVGFRALELGALAVLPTPRSLPGKDQETANLILQVKAMAGVRVVRRSLLYHKQASEIVERGGELDAAALPPKPVNVAPETINLVAMGVSTGGPQALQSILSLLPADFAVPVVVVQHISVGFLPGLVQWLAETTPLRCKIAQQGEALVPGTVYLAPDRRQMAVRTPGYISLNEGALVDGHCPSATALFESVASAYRSQAVGVLLTGMGEDGARGLQTLRSHGGYTLAQDEGSSVVFGMPKAAIELGAANEIIPLDRIAQRLVQLVKPR